MHQKNLRSSKDVFNRSLTSAKHGLKVRFSRFKKIFLKKIVPPFEEEWIKKNDKEKMKDVSKKQRINALRP